MELKNNISFHYIKSCVKQDDPPGNHFTFLGLGLQEGTRILLLLKDSKV